MPTGHYRFRRSSGNVSSNFRGARPDTYPLIDPDVAAFAAESGATDLDGLDALVTYLKAESLYSNFVIYPMKSAQNAGSGSTVYSLGGLTTNDMALVGTPSWSVDGVDFVSASSQHGTVVDFLGTDDLTVFFRTAEDSAAPTADSTLIAQFETTGDERSWWFRHNGTAANDPYVLLRYVDGTSATSESYAVNSQSSVSDRTLVSQWTDGGGRAMWIDKASQSLTLIGGSAQTARVNSTAPITVNCVSVGGVPSFFNDQEVRAASLLYGVTPTTAQRETITDFINAL